MIAFIVREVNLDSFRSIKIMKSASKQTSFFGFTFFALTICLIIKVTSFGQMEPKAKPMPKSTVTKPAQKPVRDDYFSSDPDALSKVLANLKETEKNRTRAKELYTKGDFWGAIPVLNKPIENNFLDTVDMELRARC